MPVPGFVFLGILQLALCLVVQPRLIVALEGVTLAPRQLQDVAGHIVLKEGRAYWVSTTHMLT